MRASASSVARDGQVVATAFEAGGNCWRRSGAAEDDDIADVRLSPLGSWSRRDLAVARHPWLYAVSDVSGAPPHPWKYQEELVADLIRRGAPARGRPQSPCDLHDPGQCISLTLAAGGQTHKSATSAWRAAAGSFVGRGAAGTSASSEAPAESSWERRSPG
jgi:hypothetical protein